MDKETELKIENAIQKVMNENGGEIGIFNPMDIARVSMIADVCPKLVKQHFMKSILGN